MESKGKLASDELPANETPAYSGRRLIELDSLRGLAACSVAIYHLVLGWFSFRQPAGITSVLLKTLYPIYAGPEAVRLFFVLSGMVLAISFGYERQRQSYRSFLSKRVMRIYIPYLFALILAVLGASKWHGPIDHSAIKNCCWSDPVSPALVLQHVLFIGDYDFGQLNPVFWSLVHEMRISIIFPLLFMVVRRLTNRGAILLAGGCTLSSMLILRLLPQFVSPILPMSCVMTVHYLALFIMGILLARNLGGISMWYARQSNARRLALLLFSLVIYSFTGIVSQALFGSHLKLVIGLSDWGTAAGAAGIIVTCHSSLRARLFLHSKVPLFLGRISYSLYLIHIPILLALVFSLQQIGAAREIVIVPAYFLASLVAAYTFCVLIEEPFLRLGKHVGRAVGHNHQSWIWTRIAAIRG
jgi:peptidoglycan/LPS O-acetylase OafA/YrhL